MYKDLLIKMLKIIEEKHLDMYFNITKKELNNYIEEVLKKYELKDKYDFYYIANMIIKKIFGVHDSHTKLVWKNGDFYLPIRLDFNSDKLYIKRVDEDNKDLLYGEVLKINGVEIKQIINEIKDMVASSTEEHNVVEIETALINGYKIKSLPSINNDCNEFEFEVEKDNQIIKRKLTKSDGDLLPINKPESNYSYDIIDDKIRIVYNACKEEYEGQMKEFVSKIKTVSEENNIDKYIIDIRGNRGGNSNIINSLIDYLTGKKIVTLIDEYVFSGGRWALFDLKNIGSTFVGTGIGTSMNCFGNAPSYDFGDFILPITNKYFYFDKDCNIDNFHYSLRDEEVTENNLKDKYFISFNEIKNNKDFSEPQIFEPDYYVKNNIYNYKNNNDMQLEIAISILNIKNDNIKDKFLKLKSPDELMKFMNKYIMYGWKSVDSKLYINTMKNLREKYIISSLDEMLETGLGTCIEQANMIKSFFDRMDIENRVYCNRSYETEENFEKEIKMHCFVLFKQGEKWYHFEHSNAIKRGIYEYDSVDSAIKSITSEIDQGDIRKLTEIDSIPSGLSFFEFNEYVNQFDNKKEL